MATAPAPSAASGSTKSTKSTAKKATKAGATKTKAPRKPKKPAAAKSQAANSSQQAYAAGRTAQMDLASIRNDAAARRLDPLWYKAEDVLPSVADDSVMSENAKLLPEQIQIVEAALKKNNLSRSDVTPQAFACLLEQARRYAMEILTDSQDYAFVAGRNEIDRADLLLANEFRPDHPISVSTQLPKLNLLAQTINREPLPPIPTHCYSGVLLPPKNHQLTARTFDVVTNAQTARRMVQAVPPPPHKLTMAKKKSPTGKGDKHKPSYGAARGRQISVNLKTKKEEDTKKAEESKKGSTEGQEPTKMEIDSKETTEEAGVGATAAATATTAAETAAASTAPPPPDAPPDAKASDPVIKKEEDYKMEVDKKEESTAAAGSDAATEAETAVEAPELAATKADPSTAVPQIPTEAKKDEGGSLPMDTSPGKS